MNIANIHWPDTLWYLPEWDTWAQLHDDGTATVGITQLGIELSREFYMCRPKPLGTVVEQGRSIAVAELAKSVVSVKTPVSGEVIALNTALEDQPNLPFQDPYGQGWLARIRLSRWAEDVAALKQGPAIESDVRQRMVLYRLLPLDGADA